MITVTLAGDCPAERNSSSTTDARYEFAQWFMTEDIVNAREIYIDEYVCNIHTRRTQGREGKSRTESLQKHFGPTWSQYHCVLRCISMWRSSSLSNSTRRYEKTLITNFLQVLCGNIILDEGEDATEFRIFDNAPGRRGLEDMNCNGIFKIKRLPKYSLFLPMVENTSSCWTSALKRNLAERMDAFQKPTEFDVAGRSLQQYGFDTLRGIIEATACQITETKCIGRYNHTMSYIP